MKRISTFAIVVAMAGALAACGPGGSAPSSDSSTSVAAAKPDTATEIGPNTYRNKALGLTVTAPEGWYVAPSDVMEKMMAVGSDLTTSNMGQGAKAAVQSAMQRTASIFTFMEHPPGSPVPYMTGVMGMTEDVGMLPGIKRGSDYFFHARQLMEQSAVPTKVGDGYATRMIGGRQFDRMDVEMGDPDRMVKQRYFATRHGDVIFALIQSYRTNEDLAALDKVLDSIKLDW